MLFNFFLKHPEELTISDIYIPQEVKININSHLGLKNNYQNLIEKEINRSDLIAQNKGLISLKYHASIPGKIKYIDDNCIIRFSGKSISLPRSITDINKYSRENFLKNIKNSGIIDNIFFPIPINTKIPFNCKSINNLEIIAYDLYPIINTNNFILWNYNKEINNIISVLKNLFNIKKIKLHIEKEKYNFLQKRIINKKYSDLSIKQKKNRLFNIPNYEWNKNFSFINSKSYVTNFIIEKQVISIETLYLLYQFVFYNKVFVDKLITLCIEKNDRSFKTYIINTPIGTSIKHILNVIDEDNNYYQALIPIYKNLQLTDNLKELYIQKNMNCIILFKDELQSKQFLNKNESICNFCGFCSDYCPANLNPYLIFKDKKALTHDIKKNNRNKCIECKTCKLICPENINFF